LTINSDETLLTYLRREYACGQTFRNVKKEVPNVILIDIFVSMKFMRIPLVKLPRYFTILFLVLSFLSLSGGTPLSYSLPYKQQVEWVASQKVEQRTSTVKAQQNKCIPPGINEISLSQFDEFKYLILFQQISPRLHSAGLA
jgi:hypothetical protein